MRLTLATILSILLAGVPMLAADEDQERLADSATVLEEILKIPDAVPQDLLNKAECVLVFPSVKKVAVGIGGSYGRGAMLCRGGGKAYNGPWGAPAMFRLEGANIGFQLGGQATDFLLLVMNPKGAESILTSKTKLGADASAAAGPKGRTAGASTAGTLQAEVLTYSRSKGAFAGVSLEGSTLRSDDGPNEKIYGRKITAREILQGNVKTPAAGSRLVGVLQKASPRNLSQ